MSIQSEAERIYDNVQTTLSTIAETGVTVGTNSDALPAAATALANEKADVDHTHSEYLPLSVYDPQGKAQDIFAYVDAAVEDKDGSTFIPSVDTAGNLSWTNDGGLENPETVNIMGPPGEALTNTDIENILGGFV